jgi:hypothetical protein
MEESSKMSLEPIVKACATRGDKDLIIDINLPRGSTFFEGKRDTPEPSTTLGLGDKSNPIKINLEYKGIIRIDDAVREILSDWLEDESTESPLDILKSHNTKTSLTYLLTESLKKNTRRLLTPPNIGRYSEPRDAILLYSGSHNGVSVKEGQLGTNYDKLHKLVLDEVKKFEEIRAVEIKARTANKPSPRERSMEEKLAEYDKIPKFREKRIGWKAGFKKAGKEFFEALPDPIQASLVTLGLVIYSPVAIYQIGRDKIRSTKRETVTRGIPAHLTLAALALIGGYVILNHGENIMSSAKSLIWAEQTYEKEKNNLTKTLNDYFLVLEDLGLINDEEFIEEMLADIRAEYASDIQAPARFGTYGDEIFEDKVARLLTVAPSFTDTKIKFVGDRSQITKYLITSYLNGPDAGKVTRPDSNIDDFAMYAFTETLDSLSAELYAITKATAQIETTQGIKEKHIFNLWLYHNNEWRVLIK